MSIRAASALIKVTGKDFARTFEILSAGKTDMVVTHPRIGKFVYQKHELSMRAEGFGALFTEQTRVAGKKLLDLFQNKGLRLYIGDQVIRVELYVPNPVWSDELLAAAVEIIAEAYFADTDELTVFGVSEDVARLAQGDAPEQFNEELLLGHAAPFDEIDVDKLWPQSGE